MTVFSVEVSVDERNPSRSCGHAGSEIRHTFMGTKLQGKSVTEVSQMLICPIANNAAAGGSETVRVFKERHLCACVSANPSSCDGRPTTSLPCSCDVGKMTVGHTSAAQIKRAPHHTTTKTTTQHRRKSGQLNRMTDWKTQTRYLHYRPTTASRRHTSDRPHRSQSGSPCQGESSSVFDSTAAVLLATLRVQSQARQLKALIT